MDFGALECGNSSIRGRENGYFCTPTSAAAWSPSPPALPDSMNRATSDAEIDRDMH